ncbi:MAG: hypothetical protein ACKVQK_20965 [Burkholderiales bacterium]
MTREVLLLGSVPLQPAARVFETVAKHLGTSAPRIPDGEQIGWLQAAFKSFAQHPMLEQSRQVPLDAGGRIPLNIYRLKEGVSTEQLTLGPYGYASNAINSYRQFKTLRDEGKIPAGTRFQVTLPGPGTSAYVIELPAEKLLPIARAALAREIEEIAAAIPAADLAIQLDIAMEAEHEEYLRRPNAWDQPMHKVFHWTLEQMAESAAWLAERVPAGAELGLHICSIWHHDTGAGQDNQVLVDAANAITSRMTRPVSYIHIPIIPEHEEADYDILRSLHLGAGTKLYLGLINLADGLEGTKRRITMAKKAVPDFGIAMFCGLGRAPGAAGPSGTLAHAVVPALRRATPDTLADVLKLHRDAASL